jgi:hypothetical protein
VPGYQAPEEDDVAIGVASDEDDGAIGVSDEEEAIGASEDEEAADEDDGAIGVSDEDEEATGAADDEDTTAELDEVFTVVVVAGPRLKIQIRPMITITTTMMIIQVLRFMGYALGWRRFDWEGVVSLVP